MKKIFCMLISVLLLCGMAVFPSSALSQRVYDGRGVLSDKEISELEDVFAGLYSSYGINAVVVTVDGYTEADIQLCADDFYDSLELSDGIVLMISAHEYAYSASGYGSYDEDDLYFYDLSVYDSLSEHDWYGAFMSFASALETRRREDLGSKADDVTPVTDRENIPVSNGSDKEDIIGSAVICTVISLIAAFIIVKAKEAKMNTVDRVYDASHYQNGSGLDLSYSNDLFLYSRLSVIPKAQSQNNNRSGFGGGSHGGIHTSAGGSAHIGRSGRF